MKKVLWNFPELPNPEELCEIKNFLEVSNDEKIAVVKINYKNHYKLLPYVKGVDLVIVGSIQPKPLWNMIVYESDVPIIIYNNGVWSQVLSVQYGERKGKKDQSSYFDRACGIMTRKLHR